MIDTAALLSRGVPERAVRTALYSFSGRYRGARRRHARHRRHGTRRLAPQTTDRLRELLPAFAAIGNPVDTTAEILVKPEISYGSLLAVASDPNVDAVLFPLPMEYGEVTRAACETWSRCRPQSRSRSSRCG